MLICQLTLKAEARIELIVEQLEFEKINVESEDEELIDKVEVKTGVAEVRIKLKDTKNKSNYLLRTFSDLLIQ